MRQTPAVCAVAFMLAAGGHAAAAPASVPVVGVVDFYAATPLGSFEGTSLERFAADDLSDQLVRAGAGRVVVASRRSVRQAEVSLGWRSDDPLRFDRLQALARAIGADHLVVGWITLLTVESGGSDDGGPPVAEASVVIQVFDAASGRIVGSDTQRASTLFGTRTAMAERVIHLALSPTVAELLATLARSP